MSSNILVDTGPLVAWLNPRDGFHRWASENLRWLPRRLWTSEPVLTEAAFLLA